MLKKMLVIGGVVVAVAVGAVMVAESASAATPNSTAAQTAATAGQHGKQHESLARAELRALHGMWVTKDGKTGKFVTHDEIRGEVTAVSSTSITVKAVDGTSETYAVNSSTKVHAKGDTKTKPGTVSQVKTGDRVGVLGDGTTSLTATHILDNGVPKPKTTTSTSATTS